MPALRARADIQGLRAVAVLLVVLAHAGVPGITGGFVGVDVFFVLSGYLITSILLHEATGVGSVSLLAFYAKRARRILPAATATLVATAAVAVLFLGYVQADAVLLDVLWAAFFGANIHFAAQRTDYFSVEQLPSPVQHFWSLAVEEQFYVVWPALLAAVLLIGVHRDAEAVRRRIPLLRGLLAVIVVASLTWSVVSTADTPQPAYFSTLARTWELGAGALLALAGRSLPLLGRRVRLVLGGAGLALILVAAFWFTDQTPAPGSSMLLPVLGTVALLAAGAGVEGDEVPWVNRLLGRQPLRWIGDLSYGFYLWHWPFLILPAMYQGYRLGLVNNLVLSVGALVAALLSYHLIENPIRRARPLATRHQRALLLWPAAIACILVVNSASHAYLERGQRLAAERAANVDLSALPQDQRVPRTGNKVHDAVADALDRASLDAPIVTPVRQDLRELTDDRITMENGCYARKPQNRHRICELGDPDADKTMVVYGDSHAQMWLPALERLAEEQGYRIIPLVKLGCAPYDIVTWKSNRGEYTACNEFHDWAFRQARKADPDVVVMSSISVPRSMDEPGGTVLSESESEPVWRDGVRSTSRRMGRLADEVVVVADSTRLPRDPARCLTKRGHTAADCTFDHSQRAKQRNRLTREGAEAAGARYVGLDGILCIDDRCPTIVEDIVVYTDDNHVSRTYALFVADELGRRLKLPG
jgi:peptidoglycan/LPS O-acetylase OafA/YrhL